MADTNKKVSELETASQVNNTDLMMLSQGSAGSGFSSLKTTILAIAQKIITGINFTSALETENKTIAGAINEVAQGGGGSSTFAGLSDVDIDDTTLANGQVPKWNSTTEKWENGNAGSGSGGHTILDDSGTTLTQKDNLQFKGVYTQNNGDNTEVDICRTMTKAQMEALSGEELKGFINTSDEPDSLPLTAEWVAYDSNTSVKEKIDEIIQETTLTVTSPCITDLTKVVATKKGDRVIIAFKEAVITSGVSQYGPIVEGNTRPTYQAFGRGFIDRSGTTIFFDIYANYTESRIRTGTAFQNGDKIYGSIVYFV